jgi:protein-disulfide isomerase
MDNISPLSAESPSASAASKAKLLKRNWQSRNLLLLMPVVFLVGLAAGYLIWGREVVSLKAALDTAGASASVPAVPEQVKRYDVPVDDDPSIGPENAAITLIEFSDYECPFCQRWHAETFARLREKYPDQLRIVYRDFPLANHPNAQPAAEAAGCANEQGAFWEYHDKLFAGQSGLSAAAYRKYAGEIGLDMEKFNECVETRRYREEVEADLNYAANLGVGSTPTFFLNGIPLVGAQPYEYFEMVIEKELAGEIP